jgi:hypothetical protein
LVIIDKFTLLKDIPNILNVSSSSLQAFIVDDGIETLHSILSLLEKRVNHYTKTKVYQLLNSGKNEIEIVYMPNYPLPVTYNKPTKQVIINLSSFNTKEISTMNPTSRDLYGCLVYGICLKELVTKQAIPDRFAGHITAYLLSVFIRIFGKEYGLIGIYSTQIPKLKFMISCYVYAAFFNIKGDRLFQNASIATAYNYKADIDLLRSFDFSNVNDFIKALDKLKVFPGVGKYNFVSKILRMLTIHFIPAVEDCVRFIAVLTTSDVPGITPTLSPAFYYRYNETEFATILQISKRIFK